MKNRINILFGRYVRESYENGNFNKKIRTILNENQYLITRLKAFETKKLGLGTRDYHSRKIPLGSCQGHTYNKGLEGKNYGL